VVKPGGIVAAVSYALLEVSPSVDKIIRRLHGEIVGPYWPPERRHVDNCYADLPFPFPELDPPKLTMKENWTLGRLLGYLGTWSAVRRYIQEQGGDPLDQIRKDIAIAWGDPNHKRLIRWPLTVKAGVVK
jgi:hypothetical protein